MQNIAQRNYVISLTTAQKRRKHIENEFGKQNIPFEFFDAITLEQIHQKANKLNIDISNTNLTKGEIACALSHIALWYLAKEQKLEYICIFEDDIYLGEDANKLLNINYLPSNTHILKLETNKYDRLPTIFKTETKILNRKLFRLKKRHAGAAGYLVTSKGINFLIDCIHQENLTIPIDDLIFGKYLADDHYHVLQMTPALCIQDFILNKEIKFESYLEKERQIRYKSEKSEKKRKKINLFFKIYRELTRPFRKKLDKILNAYIPFK